MYRKRREPKTDPWGTLTLGGCGEENPRPWHLSKENTGEEDRLGGVLTTIDEIRELIIELVMFSIIFQKKNQDSHKNVSIILFNLLINEGTSRMLQLVQMRTYLTEIYVLYLTETFCIARNRNNLYSIYIYTVWYILYGYIYIYIYCMGNIPIGFLRVVFSLSRGVK